MSEVGSIPACGWGGLLVHDRPFKCSGLFAMVQCQAQKSQGLAKVWDCLTM